VQQRMWVKLLFRYNLNLIKFILMMHLWWWTKLHY
jgi:hypothetical protein